MKKQAILTLSLSLGVTLAVLSACAKEPANNNPAAATAPTATPVSSPASTTTTSQSNAEVKTDAKTMREFTVEELSTYTGKDGQPGYVAINGTVYDVTGIKAWPLGLHQKKYQAGKDYSNVIMQSPHGLSVLKMLTVVGTLKK